MRKYILILLLLTSISSVISSFEKDMKYHNEPSYYYTPSYFAYACYFKLSDFNMSGYDYKIKIIGFVGYAEDGQADIYVTSKESDGLPICNPDNKWQGADYGPKKWHINNSYPNYDDCNVYDDNWHYNKDVDKFWCIYSAVVNHGPPFPMSDKESYPRIINSFTWIVGEYNWRKGCGPGCEYCNWCMHCVIVYWGAGIENTSFGVVKALFR